MPVERFYYSTLPIITALLATPAFAETHGAASEEIIVTALRTPVRSDQVTASVTVLDRKTIEQEQPVAVSDILIRTPSISISRNGGYGTLTSIRIRGADPAQTVLVIDGMRLADSSSTAGGYNFANLLADDVARIEILRGPQSILWGSDAIGGVINVQPARPEKPFEGSFAVEAGSRETVNGRVAIGGTSDVLDWRVSGSTFTTDGISARSNGTEDDGFRRDAGGGN